MSDVTWQSWPRAEIEETWARWIAANRAAQEKADWSDLADFFHEDASYGWMYSPDDMFMAVGSDQIRELAMGQEMFGFDGWSYPYVVEVIDDHKGLVVGFWRQISQVLDPQGEHYEMAGIGGSWFCYGGDGKWAWQRDFFDVGSAATTMLQMATDQRLTDTMNERFKVNSKQMPGHYHMNDMPEGGPVWPFALAPRDELALPEEFPHA